MTVHQRVPWPFLQRMPFLAAVVLSVLVQRQQVQQLLASAVVNSAFACVFMRCLKPRICLTIVEG